MSDKKTITQLRKERTMLRKAVRDLLPLAACWAATWASRHERGPELFPIHKKLLDNAEKLVRP